MHFGRSGLPFTDCIWWMHSVVKPHCTLRACPFLALYGAVQTEQTVLSKAQSGTTVAAAVTGGILQVTQLAFLVQGSLLFVHPVTGCVNR